MSSATLTDPGPAAAPPAATRDSGFRSWHFYILIAMVGATVAVMLSPETHPAALLLLSAAVIAAGLVGVALHHALTGFVGGSEAEAAPLGESRRAALEREKALTLRSIKELEFDHAMRKVGDADFAMLGARLRARAITLMQDLDRAPKDPVAPAPAPRRAPDTPAGAGAVAAVAPAITACPACQTPNDADARFCKQCGARLGLT
jgi:hypothetical protein